MESLERSFKGIWIPKEVWISKELTILEKIILVEIDSLDNEEGCFASNKYFAEFFGLSNGRISQIINSLSEKNFIKIDYERKGKQILKRIIKINKPPYPNVFNNLNTGYLENDKKVFNNLKGVFNNLNTGYLENDKDNNIINNNIINNNITNNIDNNKRENRNKIVEIYNSYCFNLPQIKKVTEKRNKAIDNLLKEFSIEQFEEICKIANNSKFLTGNNDRNWKADFDFIMRTDKATAILEGKYSQNKKDKLDDFIEMWKEAKDEEERNGADNNTFSR